MPLSLPRQFNSDGLLPVGDYELTLQELRSSMLVVGPQPTAPDWDMDHRRYLVDQLSILVDQLWQVGITQIYADGSFARDKPHPNDIDGYFVCDKRDYASGMGAPRRRAAPRSCPCRRAAGVDEDAWGRRRERGVGRRVFLDTPTIHATMVLGGGRASSSSSAGGARRGCTALHEKWSAG